MAKPVYDTHGHSAHKGFTAKDHGEAAKFQMGVAKDAERRKKTLSFPDARIKNAQHDANPHRKSALKAKEL